MQIGHLRLGLMVSQSITYMLSTTVMTSANCFEAHWCIGVAIQTSYPSSRELKKKKKKKRKEKTKEERI